MRRRLIGLLRAGLWAWASWAWAGWASTAHEALAVRLRTGSTRCSIVSVANVVCSLRTAKDDGHQLKHWAVG